MSSKERANHKTSEMLGFFMLDRYLSFKAFYFNLEKIDDMTHIMTVLTNPITDQPDVSFLNPVRNEFERLSKTNKQYAN
ncbi:hypothetical protein H8S90_23995 [Olivibacter sp. SDN3]|uniref:hypothetical protein n=1 Tax=Olivibacter sp. SDN3 TaxID=2764720 RepID=UPI001651AE8A|nr:hypothetical protein [Olivibacter sp. SDN3]QNL49734.1 hypothetical protein H8S90_23995 [Olivibacter sp. SDN3]